MLINQYEYSNLMISENSSTVKSAVNTIGREKNGLTGKNFMNCTIPYPEHDSESDLKIYFAYWLRRKGIDFKTEVSVDKKTSKQKFIIDMVVYNSVKEPVCIIEFKKPLFTKDYTKEIAKDNRKYENTRQMIKYRQSLNLPIHILYVYTRVSALVKRICRMLDIPD